LKFEEYRRHDAIGLAGLIARKQVTPAEVLDVALARLDQVNPKLNAVNNDLRAQARAAIETGLPDGPLKGVPFLLKDIGVLMKGVRTCAGSRLFKDSAPAAVDSALVAAYRKAGLVLFGKTNTPEFGMSAATETVAFGITRNPWDTERTPGGSSGGTAAAVAAGVVPASHGSDGGGSIRIPAACCGLFGLKPSRGRISNSPLGDANCGPAVNHVLTRSVRDSALLLDLSCQPVAGDFYWITPPETPFLKEVGRDPGKLRIGYVPEPLMWHEMDAEVREATAEAARFCESLGHHVEETKIDFDFRAYRDAISPVYMASMKNMFDLEAARRGRPITRDDLEDMAYAVLEESADVKGTEVAQAYAVYYAMGQAFARVFEKYDVLLQPTVTQLPVPIGALRTMNWPDRETYTDALYRFMPNTQPYNATGSAAMSIPLAMSKSGLPIGIHFAASPGAEALLLRLAGQLEKARPWFDRVPPEPASW
jgi:amidase